MLRFVLLVSLLQLWLGVDPCSGRMSYTGSQVWRVTPESRGELEALQAIRGSLDFWTDPVLGRATDIRTDSRNKNLLFEVLSKQGIKHQLLIGNVQALVDQEMQHMNARVGGMSWTNFQSFTTINNWLGQISEEHKNVSNLITIGKSTEGRVIRVIRIGLPVQDPAQKKRGVWIDGGFHAREWASPATVTWFINELLTHQGKYESLLKTVDFYIAPVMNPDGYEFTRNGDRFWRKTRSKNTSKPRCPGVDPNRNFDFHWNGPGNSRDPCSEVYKGPRPFSEPETLAMRDFINKMNSKVDWKLYLTMHSYGQVIISPWGYTKELPPDHAELKELGQSAAKALARKHGTQYKVGAVSELFPLGSGGSDDWAKGSGNFKYSYTYELRDTGKYGFAMPPNLIIPTAEETWEGVLVMANYISVSNEESRSGRH